MWMDIMEKATKSDLIDRYLRLNDEWNGDEIAEIVNLDLGELNERVLEILANYADDEAIVSSFNTFMTDTRGCDEQIFRMDNDLEEVWFGVFDNDNFLEQMQKLSKAISRHDFSLDDLYWEIVDYGSDKMTIRSFNEPTGCINFAKYQYEYAEWIVRYRDYDFIEDAQRALSDLFAEYHT